MTKRWSSTRSASGTKREASKAARREAHALTREQREFDRDLRDPALLNQQHEAHLNKWIRDNE